MKRIDFAVNTMDSLEWIRNLKKQIAGKTEDQVRSILINVSEIEQVIDIKISPFDCLVYIKDHPELYTEKIKKIIASFVAETTEDLFDSREKANEYVLSPEIINKYIEGELGTNELDGVQPLNRISEAV